MGKLKLILTVDYEVFGNGTGGVKECIIGPSLRIMEICERYGARVTFFVDVCEYWAFHDIELQGKYTDGYKPATWIKEQLQEAVKRGHDVQLHFHPQWLNYRWISKGNWELDYSLWRLSEVPAKDKNPEDRTNIYGLFVQGKKTLEEMIRPVKPDYVCDVFRAGAWCIQPEEEVLKAMKAAGIRFDTTVAPGMQRDRGHTFYDFTKAPKNLPFWNISSSVNTPDKNGSITEVPIYTAWTSGLKMAHYTILRLLRKIPDVAPGSNGSAASSDKRTFLQKLSSRISGQYRMLDFCNGIPAEEMMYLVGQAIKQYDNSDSENPIPLVMIGHPKTFGSPKEFERFLGWCKGKKRLVFDAQNDTPPWGRF